MLVRRYYSQSQEKEIVLIMTMGFCAHRSGPDMQIAVGEAASSRRVWVFRASFGAENDRRIASLTDDIPEIVERTGPCVGETRGERVRNRTFLGWGARFREGEPSTSDET